MGKYSIAARRTDASRATFSQPGVAKFAASPQLNPET